MYPFMLFCTSVINYITCHNNYFLQLLLWSITVQATLINFGIVPHSLTVKYGAIHSNFTFNGLSDILNSFFNLISTHTLFKLQNLNGTFVLVYTFTL